MDAKKENKVKIDLPKSKKGYFSLLQFEPSKIRQERINIAVLVEAPDYDYKGAKRLRRMESLLQAVDPNADIRLIREYASEIERVFNRREMQEPAHPLFLNQSKPISLHRLKDKLDGYSRTTFRLTEPRALVIDEATSFEKRLQRLYDSLVMRPKLIEDADSTKKKEYVRQEAVQRLDKYITIESDPKHIQGRLFDENVFDAAQKHEDHIIKLFDFISFDTLRPDISQVHHFLYAIQDVVSASNSPFSYGDFYMIYEAPSNLREEENFKVMQKAREYVRKLNVGFVSLGEVDRLGQRLEIKMAGD